MSEVLVVTGKRGTSPYTGAKARKWLIRELDQWLRQRPDDTFTIKIRYSDDPVLRTGIGTAHVIRDEVEG